MTDAPNHRARRPRGSRGPRVSPPDPWAEVLRKLDSQILLYDGLDDGLIGGLQHPDGRFSAVYSRRACLDALRCQGMSVDEAVLHLDTVLPTNSDHPPLMVLDTF